MNTENKFDITAITVCVNYAHLFKYCISNRKFFKRWIIVTTSEDKDSIKLCQENNLEYIICDEINDRTFFKSRAINRALELAGLEEEWYLFIDSDILLPDNFWDFVSDGYLTGKEQIKGGFKYDESTKRIADAKYKLGEELDDLILFTMGRVNIFEDEDFSYFDPDYYFTLTDRVMNQFSGWGFFQLVNLPKFKETYKNLHHIHPELSNNAGHDDWIFRKMFNKVISLNQYCLHLSHEGVNWDGIKKDKI